MARQKGTGLSVFKGREAKLNRAIFQALALKGPQTIYDIHKQIKTYPGLKYTKYASVNKRVRTLEESGYLNKAGTKETRAGFEASLYELSGKAHLAMLLNLITLEGLLRRLDEIAADEVLADIIQVFRE